MSEGEGKPSKGKGLPPAPEAIVSRRSVGRKPLVVDAPPSAEAFALEQIGVRKMPERAVSVPVGAAH